MSQQIEDPETELKKIQTESSATTISSVVNGMLGVTILVLPLLVGTSGIFTTIALLLFTGILYWKTCQLYLLHLLPYEFDIQETIARVLSPKWSKFFGYQACAQVYFTNLLQYNLMVEMAYKSVLFVMKRCGYTNYAATDAFTFSQFSEQWLIFILFLPMLAFFYIKNMKWVMKIAEVGTIALYGFLIFILYIFFDNIGYVMEHQDEINYFTYDIGELSGTLGFSFIVHTWIAPVMKTNKIQSNNQRDIKIVYLLAVLMYGSIGIFGYIGLLGRTPSVAHPATISDYFADSDIKNFLIEILFLVKIISMFPIRYKIGRDRLFQLYTGNWNLSDNQIHASNFTFVFVCSAMKFSPALKPALLMNFTGAFFCYFLVYLAPVMIHLIYFYWKTDHLRKSMSQVEAVSQASIKSRIPFERMRSKNYLLTYFKHHSHSKDFSAKVVSVPQLGNQENAQQSQSQTIPTIASNQYEKYAHTYDNIQFQQNSFPKNMTPTINQDKGINASLNESEGFEYQTTLQIYRPKLNKNIPKWFRITAYFFVMLIGTLLLVYGLYKTIANLVE